MAQYLILAVFAVFSWAHASAQSPILTLQGLIDSVERTYPEVLQYDERVRAIEAKAKGARSWMPPTASFGLDRFPYKPMMLNEQGPMNQAALMFSAEQMIPNPLKLRTREAYLIAGVPVEKNIRTWTRNRLRREARLLYYERLIAEQKLKVLQRSDQALELLIQSAQSRYTYNKAGLSTIYKATAKRAELKAMRVMLEGNIAESNVGINLLLGKENFTFSIDTGTAPLDSSLALHSPPLTRSDIQAMESSIRAMQLEREWMQAARKPDFGLRLSHMQMFGMPNQFSLMGMVTIPVAPWAARMWRSDVLASEFEIKAMQWQVAGMQRMASRMASERIVMFRSDLKQWNVYRQELVPAYRKSMDASLIAWKQNTESFFVVMDSWEMLLMNELTTIEKYGALLCLQAELLYEIEK